MLKIAFPNRLVRRKSDRVFINNNKIVREIEVFINNNNNKIVYCSIVFKTVKCDRLYMQVQPKK